MYKLDYECKKGRDVKPFAIPNKLLLGAGPSNCSLRVLRALSQPGLNTISPEIYVMMDEIKELAQYTFQTQNRLTLGHQASGTGGLETAILNLVEPGETIMVAVAGVWGARTASSAERGGIKVVSLSTPDGEVYSLNELEKPIIKHKPVLLCMTHSESSAGTLQPLEGLGDICHKHNCLLLVDAVISLGTDPLFVDRWRIDVAVAACQKGLSAPPGMSLMTFSPRAEKRLLERKTPVPMYYDIKMMADYWNCFGNPRRYAYTYSSNVLAGIREALMQIAEEGLENVWERHRKCTERFWSGVEKHGLELFVKNVQNRTHSVTPIMVPIGVDWSALLDYVDFKYTTEIGIGIGPTAAKAVRMGFMGVNARPEVVDYALKMLVESVEFLKHNEFVVKTKTEVL